MKQSHDELIEHLKEGLAFIRSSASSFDAGVSAEAKRLSTQIRIFVHEGRGRSLLGMLGIKDKLQYMDTALTIDPRNLLSTSGLTMMRIGPEGSGYIPPLDEGPPARQKPPLDFDDWWKAQVIKDSQGNLFTRADLVLAVANKDGGAHVDPELESAYAALARSNSLGWIFTVGGVEAPFTSPVPASIRQIAYELENTIREQAPRLLGMASI